MTTVPTDPALLVEGFFDAATATVTWLLLDPASRQCAVVDSVLDYDARSGRTASAGAERVLARVAELGAKVQWILETRIHASTVAEQRAHNIHAHDGVDEAGAAAMRTTRDATLAKRQLLLPAVQVNMRGGALPEPRYLKIALDTA